MSMKKMKVIKAIGFITSVLILLAAIGYAYYVHSVKSIWLPDYTVEDYGSRIIIWDEPAGSSGRSKLDDMNISYGPFNYNSVTSFGSVIANTEYEDIERTVDTYTYLYEIDRGFESRYYDDQPYIIPYIAEGSDTAVIILPGGGYAFKSMDGSAVESLEVADTLNRNGISAFVLHYRSNPYEYPIPALDVQRAVRYIRFHADEFGIDPDRIGLIGFSAGGNAVGTFINQIQGEDLFPDGYTEDMIDETSDQVMFAAMIYPPLSFRENVPMLFALFDDDELRDPVRREQILELTDLYRHISSQDTPQFIAYGTNDGCVGMDETVNYINHAEQEGCSITYVVAEGMGHGFGQQYYMNEFIDWLNTL